MISKTHSFKQNKTLRAGAVLAIVALITLIALSFTFAKYVSEGSGSDNARVAKWGLGITVPQDLDLFSNAYKSDGAPAKEGDVPVVDSSDKANVVAPGTHNSNKVATVVYNGGYPEVMYDFNVALTIQNQKGSDTEVNELLSALDENPSWTWTLTDFHGDKTTHKTYSELISEVNALSQSGVAPNSAPTCFNPGQLTNNLEIGWDWAFYKTDAIDDQDTRLGNLVAEGKLQSLKVTLTVGAEQTQTDSSILDPQLEIDTIDMDLDKGESQDRNFYTASDGAVSVSSSDETIATVNASNSPAGKVTVLAGNKEGSATITIATAAKGKYAAGEKSFTVNVGGIGPQPEPLDPGIVVPTEDQKVEAGKSIDVVVSKESSADWNDPESDSEDVHAAWNTDGTLKVTSVGSDATEAEITVSVPASGDGKYAEGFKSFRVIVETPEPPTGEWVIETMTIPAARGEVSVLHNDKLKLVSFYEGSGFSGFEGLIMGEPDGVTSNQSVQIPSEIKYINENGEEVTLPVLGVAYNSDAALASDEKLDKYPNLKNITIPDGIRYLDLKCLPSLESCNVPASAQASTDNMESFYKCKSLKTLDLSALGSEEPATIPHSMCADCNSLSTVILPDNIKEIEQYAFNCCYNLSNVVYKGTTYSGLSNLIDALTDDEVETPISGDFHDAFMFTKLNEKTGTGFNVKMSEDGREAYIESTNDINETLLIPDSFNGVPVTEIIGNRISYTANTGAFRYDYFIKKAIIPDTVRSITREAFFNDYQLEELTIGSGLEKIPGSFLGGCTALSTINYNGTVEQWNSLEKESWWDDEVPDSCVVHCTDGNIPIRPVNNVFEDLAGFFGDIGDAITSIF